YSSRLAKAWSDRIQDIASRLSPCRFYSFCDRKGESSRSTPQTLERIELTIAGRRPLAGMARGPESARGHRLVRIRPRHVSRDFPLLYQRSWTEHRGNLAFSA